MDRGSEGPIVVVGQGPGNAELVLNRAFSGSSGKRLNKWLIECGAKAESPRAGLYMTSVIKCASSDDTLFSVMARNCRPFLNQQLSIIQPKLVITLGREAYEELRFESIPYEDAVCREFRSQDSMLMTPVGFHYSLLPWPHPSGLNRWHNHHVNSDTLKLSFAIVRRHIS